MRTELWPVILFSGLLYPGVVAPGQVKNVEPTKVATISALVTDTFGALLPNAQIEIRRLDGDPKMPMQINGSIARGVPYGTYRISAELGGFTIGSRTVEVDQPVKWVTLALALGEIEGPSTRDIRGRVEPPMETVRPVWVKIVGIYSHVVKEAPVNEKGHFLIEDVHRGAYLVMVLDPGHVLKVQQFRHFFPPAAPRGEELVITLSH